MSNKLSSISMGTLSVLLLALIAAIFGAVFTTMMTRTMQEKQALADAYGIVNATLIVDPIRCKDCTDPLFLIDRLKEGAGVSFRDEKVLQSGTEEASALIDKYKIKKIPAMILTADVAAYPLFQNTAIGSMESDGAFVLRDVPLPYFDLTRERVVRGDATLIMITSASCRDCYDVENHEKILATFGVQIAARKKVDIASVEGKKLIRQYGITKVPTILLSPEANDYAQLAKIWAQVGTIAPDGWYVFNKFQELGPVVYNDLALRKIIRPALPQGAVPK
ncbi:hypothetical protein HY624_00330 [Candidatus Uhrbacteria bacterium]|nr:hypothetical protein [Candidatus Uhrbacteria bacterium]